MPNSHTPPPHPHFRYQPRNLRSSDLPYGRMFLAACPGTFLVDIMTCYLFFSLVRTLGPNLAYHSMQNRSHAKWGSLFDCTCANVIPIRPIQASNLILLMSLHLAFLDPSSQCVLVRRSLVSMRADDRWRTGSSGGHSPPSLFPVEPDRHL